MKNIALFAFILLCHHIYAQNPLPYIPGSNATYFDVHQSFTNFLDNPDNQTSRLNKKFARWEYFYANRIDETGHIPTLTYWNAWKKAALMRGKSREYSNWTELGPRKIPHNIIYNRPGGIGRIDCITFHPTDENIYWIGTPSGGLWKTYDDGENWECLTDGLPTLGVSDIKVHPQNEDMLFIATGTRDTWWETFSVGILKSYDGGYSWEETGLSLEILDGEQVNEILINPENPDKMIAATSMGIFISNDGSNSWEQVTYTNVRDIAFKPDDYSTIYATTFEFNGGAEFLRSDNGGQNFYSVNTVGFNSNGVNRICIGVTPEQPQLIYLLCSSIDNNMYGFYKSSDGGENWNEPIEDTQLNLIGYDVDGHDDDGFGYYMMGFAVSPENGNELYAGGANIWKSTDGGVTWNNSADWLGRQGIDYVHADQHILTYNSLNMAVFSGCDGGIYKKEQYSDDWIDRSEKLGILQVYKIGLFYNDDARALLGPQDNGIISLSNNSLKEIKLAEAGDNFYNQNDSNQIFVSGYGLGLCKSQDGGDNLIYIQPNGETRYVFNPPYLKHPTQDIIYCAFDNVYRSYNWGNSWIQIMTNPTNSRILSLEVAASDPEVLYAATGKQIWRTSNGGAEWTEITSGIQLYYTEISDICISDQNPQHVWVTISGYNSPHKIYYSTDGGDNWMNISLNLPNIPVNCITHEPNTESAIYIGTDLGVFYYNNSLDEWISFNDGLPNVIVNELEINPLNQKIKAGTFGRGLWESNLMDNSMVHNINPSNNKFRIFPNPNKGQFTIELKSPAQTDILIQLFNIEGKQIWSQNKPNTGNSISLSFPQIPVGSYILKLTYDNNVSSNKIKIVK